MNYRERYVDHCDPFPETLARGRRLALFKNATGLREIPLDEAGHIREKLQGIFLDHESAWTDGENVLFLNEPYHPDLTLIPGLSRRELPTNISPYCGRWNPAIGAVPCTRSFLYIESENAAVLLPIMRALNSAARNAPPWNQVAKYNE